MELKNLKKKKECLMTVDKLAVFLSIPKSTIYNLTMKEAIPIIMLGSYLGLIGRLSSFGWLKAGATVRGMKGLLNNVFAFG